MQKRRLFSGMLAVLAALIMISVPVLASEIPDGYYKARGGNDMYEFRNDGTVVYNGIEGIYTISRDTLTVIVREHAYKYTFEILDNMLILYGTDNIGDVFDAVGSNDYIGNLSDEHIVTFGIYEQDNDLTNGQEPIEWVVLKIQDGKALLLSRYALECMPYNEEDTDVTWETCTLRTWLNEDFLNTAFTPSETAVIAEITVRNADNATYGTEGGNDTVDRIFLLSPDEIEQYFGIGPDKWVKEETDNSSPQESLVCRYTEYGKELYICNYAEIFDLTTEYAEEIYIFSETEHGQNFCWWWLRSPGCDSLNTAGVGRDGSLYYFGNNANSITGGVRPALWINLK